MSFGLSFKSMLQIIKRKRNMEIHAQFKEMYLK